MAGSSSSSGQYPNKHANILQLREPSVLVGTLLVEATYLKGHHVTARSRAIRMYYPSQARREHQACTGCDLRAQKAILPVTDEGFCRLRGKYDALRANNHTIPQHIHT